MPIGDEDVAVRRHQDRGRRVEFVRTVAGHAGLAELHQQLAVGTEFEDLLAFAVLAEAVRDPDIAVRSTWSHAER